MTRPAPPDDDDWVGTPPEGRHSADRARPDFWRHQRPPMIGAAAIGLVVVVAVVVTLLS
jgi:hypothetical protein